MVRYQVAGYQVGGHQVVEYRVVEYQTAGNPVASCGGWGTGLGSGADTRSRYHSPDCQRPETFNPGVVPHCPTALSTSAIPPTNGSVGPGKVPPGPMVSLGISGPRAQPSTPQGGSGAPCPPKAPPGPRPAALRTREVPALSTPGCVGSYSHLPAGVGLGVINHQLQGLPLVGLDEREEVFRLRQTQGLSLAPSKMRHFSQTAPISPHPIEGAWGRSGRRFLTSWRIWSEPTT